MKGKTSIATHHEVECQGTFFGYGVKEGVEDKCLASVTAIN